MVGARYRRAHDDDTFFSTTPSFSTSTSLPPSYTYIRTFYIPLVTSWIPPSYKSHCVVSSNFSSSIRSVISRTLFLIYFIEPGNISRTKKKAPALARLVVHTSISITIFFGTLMLELAFHVVTLRFAQLFALCIMHLSGSWHYPTCHDVTLTGRTTRDKI